MCMLNLDLGAASAPVCLCRAPRIHRSLLSAGSQNPSHNSFLLALKSSVCGSFVKQAGPVLVMAADPTVNNDRPLEVTTTSTRSLLLFSAGRMHGLPFLPGPSLHDSEAKSHSYAHELK